ncbi:GDP-D-mannose dehydratase, NAD(P)-binding (fragment) [Mesorhizobium prunaredense]|uniref:GDP-mannose 4,6-dehydratase n=1 Tax=Mesorhizobium prunaredense TaxID=1631249 RepID=A0A1R3V7X4_9HYPH
MAKLYAYWITVNYREAYGLYASNGILFNHEGPTRGETFITRKVTRAVAAIVAGKQDCFYLGNLEAKRDWGSARDYVEGMWRILQHHEPDDFVLATRETHTFRSFCRGCLQASRKEIVWEGKGVDEVGRERMSNQALNRIDKRYFRPTEVDLLMGDASKAATKLGWKPKTSFDELVSEMVEADCRAYGIMLA